MEIMINHPTKNQIDQKMQTANYRVDSKKDDEPRNWHKTMKTEKMIKLIRSSYADNGFSDLYSTDREQGLIK